MKKCIAAFAVIAASLVWLAAMAEEGYLYRIREDGLYGIYRPCRKNCC